jgi:hypothetical protein
MKRLATAVAALVLIAAATPLFADSAASRLESRFKEIFADLLLKVEQAEDPGQKRALLNESLEDLLKVIDRAGKVPFQGREQRQGLAAFRAEVQEKHDELNGAAGFAMVAAADLDEFARYMVQDLEQARMYYVGISSLALILIIILLLIIIL